MGKVIGWVINCILKIFKTRNDSLVLYATRRRG
jgi:hypothetical protein